MSNQWHGFIGNLTRDPEIRTVEGKNGKGPANVANFSVAVNGRTKDDVVFYDCEVWAQAADVIVKYFKKGTPIAVLDAEGRNDTWNDKTTGEKRTKLKFRVNRFGFCPTDKGGSTGQTVVDATEDTATEEKELEHPPRRPASPPRRRAPATVPTEGDDEEIPF
jgi:single-strand DNA-binding protein